MFYIFVYCVDLTEFYCIMQLICPQTLEHEFIQILINKLFG